MSFATFKALEETLKPCKNLSASSSSSSPSPSISAEQLSQEPKPTIVIRRKPPKSSLSQQLLRFGDYFPLPQQSQSQHFETQRSPKLQSLQQETEVQKNGEEEEDDKVFEDFGRPKLGQLQFFHTGPFKPMILSLPGVILIIQVPASINCKLLEHQCKGVQFLYKLYRNNHGGVLVDDMIRER